MGQKKFGSKKILGQKSFWVKNVLGKEKIRIKKIFGLKRFGLFLVLLGEVTHKISDH